MFANDDDEKQRYVHTIANNVCVLVQVLKQLVTAVLLTGTSGCDTPNKSSEGDIELQPSTSSPSLSEQQGKTGDQAGVESSPPPNYFFKGFLAWCLWGH